jgi:hypothetical protein
VVANTRDNHRARTCLRAQFCATLWAMPLLGALSMFPARAAPAAVDVFGAWMLNRQTSDLTRQPAGDETVIIIPWGRSGWVWNRISEGRYQPKDLADGVPPPPEVDGAAANGVARSTPSMREMYYATWDGRSYRAYGRQTGQVQLKRVDDQNFEVALSKATQDGPSGETASLGKL